MLSLNAPLLFDDLLSCQNYNTVLKRYLPNGKYYYRVQLSPNWSGDSSCKTSSPIAGTYTTRVASKNDYELMKGKYDTYVSRNNTILDEKGVNAIELFLDGIDDNFEIGNFLPDTSSFHWYTFNIEDSN